MGLWQRLRGTPPCIRQSVIVNLKHPSTTALHGVLFMEGDYLLLRQASVLTSGEVPVPADGELYVPLSNVAFLQAEPPE